VKVKKSKKIFEKKKRKKAARKRKEKGEKKRKKKIRKSQSTNVSRRPLASKIRKGLKLLPLPLRIEAKRKTSPLRLLSVRRTPPLPEEKEDSQGRQRSKSWPVPPQGFPTGSSG
jgi:hypothetical protein